MYIPGLPDFPWHNAPKLGENASNDHKIRTYVCQMVMPYMYIPSIYKIYLTAVQCAKIYHSTAFQNIKKLAIFGMKIYYLATLVHKMSWGQIGFCSALKNAFEMRVRKVQLAEDC
jgi:hypothetical protein